jgi:phage protein D
LAHSYQILVGGSAVDASVYAALSSLEVEENADLPGAIQLTVPVSSDGSGDLTYVNDATFQPYANLAVVVTADGKPPECIFDGYVLSHKLHLDRGTTSSTLQVWGQDASWLMNLAEVAKEWADLTDGDVANSIFGTYGFTPAPDNTQDDSATHTESGHTLMQRASDIQFLRQLARRNGKLCRVACGAQAGQRTGYFAKPNLSGSPVATLTLNDPAAQMLSELDITWDVTRPTEVKGMQALFTDASDDGATADVTDSGLTSLAARDLASFAGKSMTVMLTTTVDDAGELGMRATSLLREGGFFVRCTGVVDLSALGVVLRVGALVTVNGIGSVHSGTYYVWSVKHAINLGSYQMSFVLVRNAVGSAPSTTGDLLGSLASP